MNIMIQGTSSGVGKSILTTALCRIFTQDGYKTVPFKSQNMSPNYHELPNKDKMARSQAIAAYACNIQPSVDMNPILLTSNGKGETEVILEGKSLGRLEHTQHYKSRPEMLNIAVSAYERLEKTADIVVIEGAGSPVEMNLIKNDIVNMGLATRVKSPVVLVSDIARGGVFASLYGTIMLMSQKEKEHIKGIVINKFKGDIQYFADGQNILEELCKKPLLGIVPHFEMNIEDEDTLTDNGTEKTKEKILHSLLDQSEEGYYSYLNSQFDLIANTFRNHLDMKKIYKIIEQGV